MGGPHEAVRPGGRTGRAAPSGQRIVRSREMVLGELDTEQYLNELIING